jgi:hypothetical protein
MRKKSTLAVVISVAVLIGLAGGLVAALKHEPGFYRRNAVAPGDARVQQSKDCFKQFLALFERISEGRGKWISTFTQDQINSYFEEDFVRLHDAEAVAKIGIHEPRVGFENDTMRIAFRYGSGYWSTVFTYEVRVWLVPNEVNTLAVEILQRKAGGVPIAAQSLLNDLKELARNKNLDVSWYRHDSNPVAVIRLPNNRARPNAQLLRFEVADGRLIIEGQSVDAVVQ